MKRLFTLIAVVGMGAFIIGCGEEKKSDSGTTKPPVGGSGAAAPGSPESKNLMEKAGNPKGAAAKSDGEDDKAAGAKADDEKADADADGDADEKKDE